MNPGSTKPFAKKTFYLDLKCYPHEAKLAKNIKFLGGRQEHFFNKDVSFVVTNRAPTKAQFSTPATPLTNSSFLSPLNFNDGSLDYIDSPAQSPGVMDTNPSIMSRGKSLLQKAREKKQGGTSDILEICKQWNIKVYHVQKVSSWIEKFMVLYHQNHVSQQKQNLKKIHSTYEYPRKISAPFIKIEDLNKKYSTRYKEFKSWTDVISPSLSQHVSQMHKNLKVFGNVSSSTRPPLVQLDSCLKPSLQSVSTNRSASFTKLHASNMSVANSVSVFGRSRAENENATQSCAKKTPKDSKKKSKKRYCEVCDVYFTDVDVHVEKESHVLYMNKEDNYAVVKDIISSLPQVENFLVSAAESDLTRESSSVQTSCPGPSNEDQNSKTELYSSECISASCPSPSSDLFPFLEPVDLEQVTKSLNEQLEPPSLIQCEPFDVQPSVSGKSRKRKCSYYDCSEKENKSLKTVASDISIQAEANAEKTILGISHQSSHAGLEKGSPGSVGNAFCSNGTFFIKKTKEKCKRNFNNFFQPINHVFTATNCKQFEHCAVTVTYQKVTRGPGGNNRTRCLNISCKPLRTSPNVDTNVPSYDGLKQSANYVPMPVSKIHSDSFSSANHQEGLSQNNPSLNSGCGLVDAITDAVLLPQQAGRVKLSSALDQILTSNSHVAVKLPEDMIASGVQEKPGFLDGIIVDKKPNDCLSSCSRNLISDFDSVALNWHNRSESRIVQPDFAEPFEQEHEKENSSDRKYDKSNPETCSKSGLSVYYTELCEVVSIVHEAVESVVLLNCDDNLLESKWRAENGACSSKQFDFESMDLNHGNQEETSESAHKLCMLATASKTLVSDLKVKDGKFDNLPQVEKINMMLAMEDDSKMEVDSVYSLQSGSSTCVQDSAWSVKNDSKTEPDASVYSLQSSFSTCVLDNTQNGKLVFDNLQLVGSGNVSGPGSYSKTDIVSTSQSIPSTLVLENIQNLKEDMFDIPQHIENENVLGLENNSSIVCSQSVPSALVLESSQSIKEGMLDSPPPIEKNIASVVDACKGDIASPPLSTFALDTNHGSENIVMASAMPLYDGSSLESLKVFKDLASSMGVSAEIAADIWNAGNAYYILDEVEDSHCTDSESCGDTITLCSKGVLCDKKTHCTKIDCLEGCSIVCSGSDDNACSKMESSSSVVAAGDSVLFPVNYSVSDHSNSVHQTNPAFCNEVNSASVSAGAPIQRNVDTMCLNVPNHPSLVRSEVLTNPVSYQLCESSFMNNNSPSSGAEFSSSPDKENTWAYIQNEVDVICKSIDTTADSAMDLRVKPDSAVSIPLLMQN